MINMNELQEAMKIVMDESFRVNAEFQHLERKLKEANDGTGISKLEKKIEKLEHDLKYYMDMQSEYRAEIFKERRKAENCMRIAEKALSVYTKDVFDGFKWYVNRAMERLENGKNEEAKYWILCGGYVSYCWLVSLKKRNKRKDGVSISELKKSQKAFENIYDTLFYRDKEYTEFKWHMDYMRLEATDNLRVDMTSFRFPRELCKLNH